MQDHLPIAKHPPDDDTIIERFLCGLVIPEAYDLGDIDDIVEHDYSEHRTLVRTTVEKWIDW